jgi:hypothetical protein
MRRFFSRVPLFGLIVNKVINNPYVFSFLFFLSLWFWNYYPYLFNYFSPAIAPDTMEYFAVVNAWLVKNSGLIENYPIDLPMGFPYLMYLVWNMGGGPFELVLIQTLLLYITITCLQVSLMKYYKNAALLGYFLFAVFLSDSELLIHSVFLLSEPLYLTTIIFVVIQLLRFVKEESNLFLFSLSLVLPLVFRSNGIVLLFIPIGFLIVGILKKKYIYIKVIVWYLVVNIVFLFLSYFPTGYLNHGNFKRVAKTFNSVEKKLSNRPKSEIEYFAKYILPNKEIEVTPFYNTNIANLLDIHYISKITYNRDSIFSRKFSLPASFKSNFFIEEEEAIDIDFYREMYREVSLFDCGFIPKSHAKLEGLIQLMRRNTIFYLSMFSVFVLVTCVTVYRFLFKKEKLSKRIILLFTLLGIHYINLLVIYVEHGNYIYRYLIVTEISLYVVIILLFNFFLKFCKSRCKRGIKSAKY